MYISPMANKSPNGLKISFPFNKILFIDVTHSNHDVDVFQLLQIFSVEIMFNDDDLREHFFKSISFIQDSSCNPNPCATGAACVPDASAQGFSCTCAAGQSNPLCNVSLFLSQCFFFSKAYLDANLPKFPITQMRTFYK